MRLALSAAGCLPLIAFSACSGGGDGGTGAGPLRIGVDLPLSGPEGPAAQPVSNGIRFFIQQHPKLDGFDVSIVSADDAGGGAQPGILDQYPARRGPAAPWRLAGVVDYSAALPY